MPCYTRQTSQVDLGKVNAELFVKTLQEMGLNPVHDKDNQRILFGSNESLDLRTGKANLFWTRGVNQMKQAYSKQVVLSQAKRFGWGVKELPNNQFQLVKAGL